MTIFETIQNNLLNARKAKDSNNVTFWGTVLARVKIIEKGPKKLDFTDENVAPVIQKIIKETKETIETASNSGRNEVIEKANREIAMLQNIIPENMKEVSEQELKDEIVSIISTIPDDQKKKAIGIVMKSLKQKFGNRFDGKVANSIVKNLL